MYISTLVFGITCPSTKSVLVKSISRKSEKWYTRINRLREKRVINNIAKVDKEKAIAIAKIIGERNDSNE